MIRHKPGQDDDQHQFDDFARLYRQAADVKPVLCAIGFLADEQRQRQQCQRDQHHRPDEEAEGSDQPDDVDAYHHRQQSGEIVRCLRVGVGRVGVVEHEDAQRAQEVRQ